MFMLYIRFWENGTSTIRASIVFWESYAPGSGYRGTVETRSNLSDLPGAIWWQSGGQLSTVPV